MTTEGKKKLFVSRKIIEEMVCDLGVDFTFDNWEDAIPDVEYVDHRNCVRWAVAAEKRDPIKCKGYGLFVRTLPYIPKFKELQPTQEELLSCDWNSLQEKLKEGMMKYGLHMDPIEL